MRTTLSRVAFGAALASSVLAAAPSRATAATQPVVAVEPAEDPPYNPADRRDPFRPPSAGATRRSADEPRTPLQRYELGQLKLVAIIYDTREPRAVLEDDEGIGYIIKVGTPVGLNDGVVRTIERGRVVVEESSVDFYGEAHPSDVVLELRTADKGK